MQRVRVAVSGGTGGRARAGIYTDAGKLVGVTQDVSVPEHPGETWLVMPFRDTGLELATASESLWLAVQFDQDVDIVVDETSADSASRLARETWTAGLATQRNWTGATEGWQRGGKHYAHRMQIDMGDVSVLPGSLPLILEAPHGGRILTGWPKRQSGNTVGDWNTDKFAQQLRFDLGRRCKGRMPKAVIFHVSRQGIDANRGYGSDCCDLAEKEDREMALALHTAYHGLVKEQVESSPGALLLNVHGMRRNRIEVGVRLSTQDLNDGAASHPPSLEPMQALSSLRALGPADEVLWGPRSIGALLMAARPGLEVVPSSKVRCPNTTICPGSLASSYYRGGYGTSHYASDTQPAMQFEMPGVMRGVGLPGPDPEAVHQVGAAMAAFLNDHYGEECETSVSTAPSQVES